MKVDLFIALLLLSTGACVASTYEVTAIKRGWTVGSYYRLYGLASILGGILAIAAFICSIIFNPWWSSIIVFISALILSQILIEIFKVHSQILSATLTLGAFVYTLILIFSDR